MSPTQPSSASYTSLDTEHFLSFLFGKDSTHGLANGLQNEATWRGYRRKILRELRRYVDANVLTDAFHQQRLDVALEKVEEAQGSGTHFSESRLSLLGLVELCLLLLGGMPDHWDRRVVNKPHHRRLDRQRTLTYGQSPEQRARLIFDACQKGFVPGMDRKAAPEMLGRREWLSVRGRSDRLLKPIMRSAGVGKDNPRQSGWAGRRGAVHEQYRLRRRPTRGPVDGDRQAMMAQTYVRSNRARRPRESVHA